MDTAPHFYAKDRYAWRAWLIEHHERVSAVWLVFDKGPNRAMSWQDIVQESLCFGWIDSRPGKVSDTQSKIYICKRKPRSVWSRINKQYVSELIASGQMTPAGMAAVDRAKDNGSWQALEMSDNLVHPPELIKMFNDFPDAKQNFLAFPVSSQRNALQWIYDARTVTTRQSRVEQIVAAAIENKRLR